MRRFAPRARGGTVLICVLACLVVVTALIGSGVQTALRGRNAVRIHKQLRQTELLLEAGVLRATQQLKKSADYEGEQWRPQLLAQPDSTPERSGDDTTDETTEETTDEALVEIRVTETEDSSTRAVEVVARFDSPSTSTGPLRRSHQFTFEIPATSSSENQ